MSVRLMAMVFDASGFTPTQKLVMLALADHANEEGKSIYPSVARVCKKTALKERVVRRTLSELRDKDGLGVIRITGRSTMTHPNEYAINVTALKSMVVDPPAPDAPPALNAEPPALNAEPPALNAPKSSLTIKEPSLVGAAKKPRRTREIDPAQKELTQYFSELTHLPIPEPKTGKDWAAAQELWFRPINRIYGLANGRGRDLVRQSVEKMRADHLTISSPKSIEKVALAIFGENYRRYQAQAGPEPDYDPMAALNAYLLEQEK